jgi:Uncharacterized protein conserved in bacteria
MEKDLTEDLRAEGTPLLAEREKPLACRETAEEYRMFNEEHTIQKNSARSQDADPFLFAPESEMWRINRERCGLIYGPAAAILQVAHPRIAQGVHDHSNFRTDTMGRLRRTLEGTNRIAFGRASEAEAIKARLTAVHGRFGAPSLPASTGRTSTPLLNRISWFGFSPP